MINLHIFFDNFYSKKMIEFLQSNLNLDEHYFILISTRRKLVYVKPGEYVNTSIYLIKNSPKSFLFSKNYQDIQEKMNKADNIFIHYLSYHAIRLLLTSHCKGNVIWVIWGADLYNSVPIQLYDVETMKMVRQIRKKKFFPKGYVFLFFSFNYLLKKLVIKKITSISSTFIRDLAYTKKYLSSNLVCHHNTLYPKSINVRRKELNTHEEDEIFNLTKNFSKLILLGNSADISNNHLDMFLLLKKIKNRYNFAIICPLSYGKHKYHTEKIINIGKNLFGKRFIPLLDYIEPEIYLQLLKKIDIAIMNHKRQQAAGNISLLLSLGKLVYLNKTGLYKKLADNAIHISSIVELKNKIEKGENIFLSDEKLMEENQIQIFDLFSEKRCKKSWQKILQDLEPISRSKHF
jgi:hypothetical protein